MEPKRGAADGGEADGEDEGGDTTGGGRWCRNREAVSSAAPCWPPDNVSAVRFTTNDPDGLLTSTETAGADSAKNESFAADEANGTTAFCTWGWALYWYVTDPASEYDQLDVVASARSSRMR